MSQKPIHRLKYPVQNYDWGKRGSKSLVARFGPEACGPGVFKFQENEPYAELCMGTHTNGLASLYHEPDTYLKSLLATDPSYFLGSSTASKFSSKSKDEFSQGPEIPFLFNILSIAKALPLQAHTDVGLAEKLNKKDGKRFVDANHKPELALALSGFRGFVGFKPLDEIRKAVNETPELKEAIREDVPFTAKRCLLTAMFNLLQPHASSVWRKDQNIDEISTVHHYQSRDQLLQGLWSRLLVTHSKFNDWHGSAQSPL